MQVGVASNCYETGCLKRNCKWKKVEMFDHVAGLLATGEFHIVNGYLAAIVLEFLNKCKARVKVA